MVAIAGQLSRGSIAGVLNERIASELDQFAFDEWPPHDGEMSSGPHGAVTARYPVSTTPREVSGQAVRTYFGDYYNRVHILPRTLELGNLISSQVATVQVWNAWLFPLTLASIDGAQDGISLIGPDTPPFEFGALQELSWDVTVSSDGPSDIDVALVWNFSEVDDASLLITGTRIVAWTFAPDWSSGVRERLAWATDVMSSDERDEQRRALRLSPRRSFSSRLVVDGRERSLFEMMLRGWGGRVWALPIYSDIQLLQSPVTLGATSITCSTTGRDFRAGGLAMLRGDSAFRSEVVQIDTVSSGSITLLRPTQGAWPAGTRLYPVRTARLAEQPRVRRHTDQAAGVDTTFDLVEPSDWPAATLPTYRGSPVLEAAPDESRELSTSFERALYVLDNVCGIPFSLDSANEAFGVREHRWVLDGINERSAFRSLLYALRGRQVSIWVPTFADDIRLLETIGSSSLVATIENIGYARFGLGQRGVLDIRIELHDGMVLYRRITNAAAIDEDEEQITIDSALGQAVAPADVRRICFMELMRGQSDEVEIQHHTDVEGVATSGLTFVGVSDA